MFFFLFFSSRVSAKFFFPRGNEQNRGFPLWVSSIKEVTTNKPFLVRGCGADLLLGKYHGSRAVGMALRTGLGGPAPRGGVARARARRDDARPCRETDLEWRSHHHTHTHTNGRRKNIPTYEARKQNAPYGYLLHLSESVSPSIAYRLLTRYPKR